jgi:small-conductance mechanosensitive channel
MWEAVKEIWNYPLYSLSDDTRIQVSQIVLVLVLLVLGTLVSRRIEKVIAKRLERTELQPDAAQLLQRLLFYSLIGVLAVTALGLLHIPLTAFAFISGAVAIGVGFGAQNIINNFISGWILMSERPVRIGDFVEIEGTSGTVETIGNRSTRIRRTDGVHMLVPNSRILENTVVNWTLIDNHVRTMIRVGVSYGSPVKDVARLIRQAVDEQTTVSRDPEPVVIFDDFGDNALMFDAYFWCDVEGERALREIRSDIRFRITELFDQNGIVIAFPQRDVHLDSPRSIKVQLVGNEPPT